MLERTIRSGTGSYSEKSYPFVSISSAKALLFLDSEGVVVQFAKSRSWTAGGGQIYFPSVLQQDENVGDDDAILRASKQVIEDTIGYVRELETID